MGTLWMLTACCLSAGTPGVLWMDAKDASSGLTVPEDGHYAVWAWSDRTAAEFKIAGTKLGVPPAAEKEKNDWSWRSAGTVELKAGKVPVDLRGTVAALALSRNESLNIEAALQDRRVLDTPEAVRDSRVTSAKHTDTVFTMPEYATREDWEKTAETLRRRILISSGLWPLPEKTPLNAEISGRTECEEYTVEKVHFEAFPGYLVTGNLYRPKGKGPFPAVVCPHGHWKNGRLENTDLCSVPGRSITLAKLGAVVFTYDMIGYVDSLQFPHNWGGDAEKLWGIHPFAMQLWGSIRAVDFVSALDGVDPKRIGCTGASGGGTQTFALYAVDDRIKVAAPVNMISCSMQGGCLCENAPLIRMANSNMEIGAMMAPRPLLMISATGDWTRETLRVEHPAIRSIYALYGAEDHVDTIQIDEGHNYNKASREAMYRFFAKWLLGRNDCDQFTEPPFTIEDEDNLRVFPGKKAPEDHPEKDGLLKSLLKSRQATAEKTLAENKALYDTVWTDIMNASVPKTNDLDCERRFREARESYVVEGWILHRKGQGDAIPALFYHAPSPDKQDAVLVVHDEGKAALAEPSGQGPGALVAGLIAQGKAVLCIDAFLTGEYHSPQALTERHRVGKFMDTFQPTDTGYRVQDVLTATAFLKARRDLTGTVDIVGLGQAGVWALFASAIERAPDAVSIIDWNQFDPSNDQAWVDQYYVPCIRSVGDVKTALAQLDPARVANLNTVEHPGAPAVEEILTRLK